MFDPGKCGFLSFARGDWGGLDPGKLRFLTFARGSMRWLTLANCVFGALPGVIGAGMTLANRIF